jgi:hypothetical protein
MHTRTIVGALIATAVLLTGCSTSNSPTPAATTAPALPPASAPATEAPLPDSALATGTKTAACWLAIRGQYAPGTVQLTGAPTTPPQCAGLSTDEVSVVATDVLEHQLDG